MEKKSIKRILLDEIRGKGVRLIHNIKYKKGLNLLKIFKREKIERAISTLINDKAFNRYGNLEIEGFISSEPLSFDERLNGTYKRLAVNDKWAENVFDCGWFKLFGDVPEKYDGELMFLVNCGGEGLIYDKDGAPKQSITCYASDFDYSLGLPTKKIVINNNFIEGKQIEFWIDGAANDLFGKLKNEACFEEASIVTMNTNIRALGYDMQALISCYDINKNDEFIKTIYKNISKIVDNLENIDENQAIEYRKILQPLLEKKNISDTFQYFAIGHAHLDLAWLWPIRETIRKGGRTFATQLLNLKRYPNYIFGASQAQLYDWIKKHYPTLYQEVKEQVINNRWELQGATWVEMDSNLISGESLIRQFYYGKKFFKEEFNEDMQILWLPDSFGYSACLPQVMKLANVPYFLTQKLSWNTVNKFPHHTFIWQGLDKSEVFAHMLPENTYNSPLSAERLKNGELNYAERKISNKSLSLFGIGDGGAGPGFEHLERLARYEDLKGMMKVTPKKAIDGFNKLFSDNTNFPTYSGELYLERHQGTYTTQSKNKLFNRKCEFLLRNYEILAIFANNKNMELPISLKEMEEIWKEVLLYQFHDILPGSSINRVYEESVARYEIIKNKLTIAIKNLSRTLFGKGILNLNSYEISESINVGDKWYKATIPSFSFVPLNQLPIQTKFNLAIDKDFIENQFIKVTFTHGRISSYFDKKLNKEFVPNGQPMCVITQYYDRGDCWDIRPTKYQGSRIEAKCNSLSTSLDGGSALAKGQYELGDNRITMIFSLNDNSPVLNIDINIDCHQNMSMLRCEFPTIINTDVCNYNVQFGHIERNTADKNSLDKAKFEACGQKFVDLSNSEYGLSLLNNCKYGFRCKSNIIDINLIRTPKGGPGEDVDHGEHNIKLGIYTHIGQIGYETYREAYKLNNPLIINQHCEEISEPFNFASFNNVNIVIESIKIADNDEGIIIRTYNSSNTEQTAELSINNYILSETVNIMEEKIESLSSKITFKPFELKLLKCIKNS